MAKYTIYGDIGDLITILKEYPMSVMEMLYQFKNVTPPSLSKHEVLILEAELFYLICTELKNIFRDQYKNYFRLLKFNTEMEDAMIESNFLRCLVQDILASEEYTLEGIAFYTRMPEDIIYDIATGKNPNPSIELSRRIIELHRTIRPEVYKQIMQKIA
jgi:hypothetical protein